MSTKHVLSLVGYDGEDYVSDFTLAISGLERSVMAMRDQSPLNSLAAIREQLCLLLEDPENCFNVRDVQYLDMHLERVIRRFMQREEEAHAFLGGGPVLMDDEQHYVRELLEVIFQALPFLKVPGAASSWTERIAHEWAEAHSRNAA